MMITICGSEMLSYLAEPFFYIPAEQNARGKRRDKQVGMIILGIIYRVSLNPDMTSLLQL